MHTRKDIIICKSEALKSTETRPPKNTDLRTLDSRPYDFKDHDVIFDFKNEYCTTNKSTHMFYDFHNIEKRLEDIKRNKKTQLANQITTFQNQQVLRQNERSKRRLVNVGFDDECSATLLYCNEEMPPLSAKPDDEEVMEVEKKLPSSDNQFVCDEIAMADVENKLPSSANQLVCDEIAMLEVENKIPSSANQLVCDEIAMSEVENKIPLSANQLVCDEIAMLEVENKTPSSANQLVCDEIAMSEVENKIPLSANQLVCAEVAIDVEEEDPYADSDDDRDKDFVPEDLNSSCSDETIIVCDKPQAAVTKKPKTNTKNRMKLCKKLEKNQTDPIDKGDTLSSFKSTEHSEISLCEYVGCDVEVFSACGKCYSFLCYVHFINENSYNDCKSHNSSYAQVTMKDKKKDKTNVSLKKTHNQKNIKIINKNTTKRTLNVHLNKNKATAPLTSENEIYYKSSESESSPVPKLRKKYDTSLSQRKLEKKNKRILDHNVKPACDNKCLKKCSSQFSEEDRVAINTSYWKMTWKEQHSFIRAHNSVAIPQRKCTTEPRRKPKRAFVLNKIDGVKINVCKHFFLTTLGYEKTNDRCLYNSFSQDSEDQRGKHQKTPLFDQDLLTQHVESFNPLAPHYRREHAPLRRYLQNDINIKRMHLNFLETYPDKIISYETYRQHVKKMNISFTQLGNEECELCEAYSLHRKETGHDAKLHIVEECVVCVDFAKHRYKYKKARTLYQEHKSIESDSEKYVSVDLEKVIMLPRMETFKSIIFCQRLTVFNETFAPVGKITKDSKPLTVIWHDAIAGRKQNDIISAFYHFLLRNRDVSKLCLWLDNCSSQNKNWLLYSLIIHLINSELMSTEQVTLNYFEPGHTFMSCDQVHHQVELAIKNRKKIYDFADFENAVGSINNSKVVVMSMGIQDFIDVPNYVSERRIQTSNPRAYLAKMVQVRFDRKSYDLLYKNDFDDQYIQLRFLNNKYLQNPSVMNLQHRSEPKGIDPNRKDAILKAINNIIPKHKQLFWKNLPETKENKKDSHTNKKRLTY